MNTQLFVEDAISISPKQILQNQRINDYGNSEITYWIDDANDPSTISLSVAGREPQTIGLDWDSITFGRRPYFQCPCGQRANKFYLPRRGTEFKCRRCHNLQYVLTSFNKHSVAGQSLYRSNRLQKLAESRANMGRVLYNGEFTKRFERFLGLCNKAGLNDVVAGANNLMALIKG